MQTISAHQLHDGCMVHVEVAGDCPATATPAVRQQLIGLIGGYWSREFSPFAVGQGGLATMLLPAVLGPGRGYLAQARQLAEHVPHAVAGASPNSGSVSFLSQRLQCPPISR
jgi:hypothetical protein